MSEELKQCPFCNEDIEPVTSNYYGTEWHFYCRGCKLKVYILRKSKSLAIKAWNRRCTPEPQENK